MSTSTDEWIEHAIFKLWLITCSSTISSVLVICHFLTDRLLCSESYQPCARMCVCVRVCMRVCECVRVCVYVCVHACVSTSLLKVLFDQAPYLRNIYWHFGLIFWKSILKVFYHFLTCLFATFKFVCICVFLLFIDFLNFITVCLTLLIFWTSLSFFKFKVLLWFVYYRLLWFVNRSFHFSNFCDI